MQAHGLEEQPAPEVRFSIAPGDLATARWLRSHAHASGVVVIDPLPSTSGIIDISDLAQAILRGLGKVHGLNTLKRKPEPLALAWLCGLGASTEVAGDRPVAVVLEAQALRPAEIEELISWFGIADLACCFAFSSGAPAADLTTGRARALAEELESYESFRHLAAAREPWPWEALEADLAARPRLTLTDPLADPLACSPNWRVPRADGLLFRSACKRMLSPEAFEVVDALFVDQVAGFLNAFAAVTDTTPARGIAKVVREAVEDAPSTEELVVVVRAAQVAALRSGYQMAVDTVRLVAAAEVRCRRGLAGPQRWWERLDGYQDPDPGALAALWGAGISLDASAILRLSDLTFGEAGTWVSSGDAEVLIEPPAARFLVVQHAYRLLSGAGPDDLLFATFRGPGITPRSAGKILREAAVDFNIDLIEDRVATRPPSPQTYLAGFGITLAKLFKARNGTGPKSGMGGPR